VRARAAAAALLLAAAVPAGAVVTGTAARVNGAEITNQRLEAAFEAYLAERGRSPAAIRDPRAYEGLRREALDLLIDEELLWQEARRLKALPSQREVEDEVARERAAYKDAAALARALEAAGLGEAEWPGHVRRQLAVRRLVDRHLARGLSVSDAEVHAFYEENLRRFTRPEQLRARHVLVAVPAGADAEARAAARGKAEAVRAEALAGADFAELARSRSDDSTAGRGGELEPFGRGVMVRPFEEAAFALEAGGISPVIETGFGFHVIKLEERIPELRLPEADVRERIREHLLLGKRQAAVARRLEALRAAAVIERAGEARR
jgi:peptidyl-prolyl cis-trans isomerase C